MVARRSSTRLAIAASTSQAATTSKATTTITAATPKTTTRTITTATHKRNHVSDSDGDSTDEAITVSKPPAKRTRRGVRIEIEVKDEAKAVSSSTSTTANSYANSLDDGDVDTPPTAPSSRSSTVSSRPPKGKGKEVAVSVATRRTGYSATSLEVADSQDENEDTADDDAAKDSLGESELSEPEDDEDDSLDEDFDEPAPVRGKGKSKAKGKAKGKGKAKAKPPAKSIRSSGNSAGDRWRAPIDISSDIELPEVVMEVPDITEDEASDMTDSSFSGSDLSEIETAGEDTDEEGASLWVDRRIVHYDDDDDDDDDDDVEVSQTNRRRNRAPRAPRAPRRRSGFPGRSRDETIRQQLLHRHPELATVWKELDQRPKIPVEKATQPDGLSLTMLPFQLEGLNWLRAQEQTMFRGGILADEMGMGKTIQTIGLLMSEPRAKPNLVIAPTVALVQWENEIKKHTNNALSVISYHGANREEDPEVLAQADVIMTTYSVLESIYRKQTTGFKRKDGIYKQDSPIHMLKFNRVILDEAHNIKDRSSKSAKAAFALQTKYKLCLSGTPLQNRIGELFSLLRFLEADPFSYYYCRNCPCKSLNWKFKANRGCDDCGHSPMHHLCLFNHELLKPIQNHGNEGPGKAAFEKLQILLKHIMLRRTKEERADDLGLPPKVVKVRRDYFNEEELDVYDSIYGVSKRKFNTYVAHGVVLNNYANIFTLITRMRQLADHPDLVLKKEALDGQNTLVCSLCDDEAEDAIKSKCHHTFCRMCVQEYISGFDGESNPDCPKCHITLNIDLTAPAIEVDEGTIVKKNSIINRIDMSQWHSSTKIEALVEELYKLRSQNHTIKSIVFSQFTSMLQLVEWRLRKAGFQTAMLEGSMTPSQRNATIQHFMENIETTVFLVSLKAGGVALNLIEASQVFIMDPWWNPSVEWQAADRIHRIGQTRACKVTRLIIEDSIESRILDLQEKKARMIHATVGGDQGAMDKLTPADMQFLFQN